VDAESTGPAGERRRRRSTPRIVSRPLINPRLAADPRLPIWTVRTAVFLAICLIGAFTIGIQIALAVAVVYAIADILVRSKTMRVIPAAARVTSAQRSTRRRLWLQRPAGYLSLHARRIPETTSIIDHLVVGPAGIFSLDSERLDRRLPLRAIDSWLYHGPRSQADRVEHAKEEARQAAALIGAEAGRHVDVHPGMVIYGPRVPWVIMTVNDVAVFRGGHIGTFFRRQTRMTRGHHLDPAEIAALVAAAARALPPIR
jgi:hypothetical protein